MDSLIRQIRQRVPMGSLDWNSAIENAFPSLEEQNVLLSEVTKCAKLNPFYAKHIIKNFVEKLERRQRDGDESGLDDALYEKLYELLPAKALDPTATDILGYTMKTSTENCKDDAVVWIRESPRLISGMGTTGMRTWEASLFLSQYLGMVLDGSSEKNGLSEESNRKIFESVRDDFVGKTVLELGCGTGFVGIYMLKRFGSLLKHLIFTDGDTQLIDRMSSNLNLNDLSVDSKKLQVRKLWWGEDDLPMQRVDTIVAADVTYDASVIPDLAEVLDEAMSQDNKVYGRVNVAYIAATIRNEVTIKTWEEYLEMGRQDKIWTWEIIESTKDPVCWKTSLQSTNQLDNIWYPVGVAEIRIYKISRVVERSMRIED